MQVWGIWENHQVPSSPWNNPTTPKKVLPSSGPLGVSRFFRRPSKPESHKGQGQVRLGLVKEGEPPCSLLNCGQSSREKSEVQVDPKSEYDPTTELRGCPSLARGTLCSKATWSHCWGGSQGAWVGKGTAWAAVEEDWGAEQECGKNDILEVTRKPIQPIPLVEVAINIIVFYY